jgi:hypothetical protein
MEWIAERRTRSLQERQGPSTFGSPSLPTFGSHDSHGTFPRVPVFVLVLVFTGARILCGEAHLAPGSSHLAARVGGLMFGIYRGKGKTLDIPSLGPWSVPCVQSPHIWFHATVRDAHPEALFLASSGNEERNDAQSRGRESPATI